MIKLCRVDHRLLHGQVAFSWTNAVQADCILVASDAVVNDEMWKTTLKLGKPAGVKLVIKDIENAVKALNSGVTTGKYSFKYLGENVTVCLEDCVFKTGYGDYVYTYDELLKLLGGK